jgi:ATP-binding cassette subfamily C (CFTR/MRP) protein 1
VAIRQRSARKESTCREDRSSVCRSLVLSTTMLTVRRLSLYCYSLWLFSLSFSLDTVYLFDDPLSAVDSHVGKHIFDKVIGSDGILGRKTRVLVTHGLTYLKRCDNIFVLKDGEISEQGTHQQLLDKKGAFAEFLIQHLQEVDQNDENLDEIKAQLEGLVKDKELKEKLERAISTTRSRSDSTSSGGSGKLSRQISTSSENELRHRRTSESPSKQAEAGKQNGTQQQKLIESEKSETGSVKWDVYKHYLKSIGLLLALATVILNMIFQGFSIGSNIWLSVWSSDNTTAEDTGKRNMYLGA